MHFFFQAEDGIRDSVASRGLGDVYKRQETHPDISRGGHRNPYQLENAIKSGGTVFCIYHLG